MVIANEALIDHWVFSELDLRFYLEIRKIKWSENFVECRKLLKAHDAHPPSGKFSCRVHILDHDLIINVRLMLIIRLFLEKQKLTQNFYEIFKVQKL